MYELLLVSVEFLPDKVIRLQVVNFISFKKGICFGAQHSLAMTNLNFIESRVKRVKREAKTASSEVCAHHAPHCPTLFP